MTERLLYSTGFLLYFEAQDSSAINLGPSEQYYFKFKSFAILKV